jgi:hypothetical protein
MAFSAACCALTCTKDMSAVDAAWRRLVETLTRLSYVVDRLCEAEAVKEDLAMFLDPLEKCAVSLPIIVYVVLIDWFRPQRTAQTQG